MKEIPLSQGKVALVDDSDFDWLMQWTWCATKAPNKWYAGRGYGNPERILYMHRAIIDAPEGIEVDHIDGDGLHNCRANLRQATHAQNLANRGKPTSNTSGYKGVYWLKRIRKWEARITTNGQQKVLGYYSDPIAAARAYDAAAIEYHGEFAYLNFP